jgi:MMPL family
MTTYARPATVHAPPPYTPRHRARPAALHARDRARKTPAAVHAPAFACPPGPPHGLGATLDTYLSAFSTSSIVFVKELGLGAVLAVLIDASIIRALLVPSLMQLLGPLNWWGAGPLRRLHNRVGLREGGPPVATRRRLPE